MTPAFGPASRWLHVGLDTDTFGEPRTGTIGEQHAVHISEVLAGNYDLVVLHPPASSWSRILWANRSGPRPVRSREHVRGFPWLSGRLRAVAERGNEDIEFCVELLYAVAGARSAGHDVHAFMDHPEDFGAALTGHPASIWQLPRIRNLELLGFVTAAIFQCTFGHHGSKPTRMISTCTGVAALGSPGWTVLDPRQRYAGPLGTSCGHAHDGGGPPAEAVLPRHLQRALAHVFTLELNFAHVPLVGVPVWRALAESPPRRLAGGEVSDVMVYIGRGSGSLARSIWANPFPVLAETDRALAIQRFENYLFGFTLLRNRLVDLRGALLRCHCSPAQACHGDAIAAAASSAGGLSALFRAGAGGSVAVLGSAGGSAAGGSGAAGGSAVRGAGGVVPLAAEALRGPPGVGPPLQVLGRRGWRSMHDGAGLCSPGRWPRGRRRPVEGVAQVLGSGLLERLRRWGSEDSARHKGDLRKALYGLAAGHYQTSPFEAPVVQEARDYMSEVLLSEGFAPGECAGDRAQPLRVRLLGAVLEAIGDPDAALPLQLALGVNLGVEVPLPRTPLVYEEKGKWGVAEASPEEEPEWRENYGSARVRPDVLLKQFREDEAEGMMRRVRLCDARREYGEKLTLAALGAIEKKPGSDKFRIIHDATHGVLVNGRIRVVDLLRFPTVSDIEGVLHTASQEPCGHFSLLYDVRKAHRVIPVRREDWGYQACRVDGERDEDGEDIIWLNLVGTFGVASAAYWWGRAAACVVRCAHALAGQGLEVDHLLYADDGWLHSPAAVAPESLLFQLFVFVVLGVPVAWEKVRGGLEHDFVGYWVDVARFRVGLSERRAVWAVRWLRDKVEARSVLVRDFKGALGRLGFAAGPLRWLRPFLGPLHAWSSACPASAFLPIPAMVLLTMEWCARVLEARRLRCCRVLAPRDVGEAFRVDAKAEGGVIVIGGWSLVRGLDTRLAPWFSLQLNPADTPWAFAKEGFRLIATFELLAVLVSLMLFCVEGSAGGGPAAGTIGITGGTDNQGNAHLLERYMTTKYPLCAVLMELGLQLQDRDLDLRLGWLPREHNQPADDLTNEKFGGFDPERRLSVCWADLRFRALPGLLERGQGFLEELAAARACRSGARGRHGVGGGPVPAGSLRERDPW